MKLGKFANKIIQFKSFHYFYCCICIYSCNMCMYNIHVQEFVQLVNADFTKNFSMHSPFRLLHWWFSQDQLNFCRSDWQIIFLSKINPRASYGFQHFSQVTNTVTQSESYEITEDWCRDEMNANVKELFPFLEYTKKRNIKLAVSNMVFNAPKSQHVLNTLFYPSQNVTTDD